MMLAINSALDALSIAICRRDATVLCFTTFEKNRHDELLVPLVEHALASVPCPAADLRAVAVTAGPGSFTGLRIGIAAAKGIALASGIPMVLVTTFDAMAERVARTVAPQGPQTLVTVLDARRGDVYAGRHEITGVEWLATATPSLTSATALAASIPPDALLAGDGVAELRLPAATPHRVLPVAAFAFDASDVGRVAWRMLDSGDVADPETCEPMYLREFVATRPTTHPS